MKKKVSPVRQIDAFVHNPESAAHLANLKLPPELWSVFALTKEPSTPEQIAARLGIDLETARTAVRSLVRRKLIQKHLVGWQDYLTASAQSVPPASPASIQPGIAPTNRVFPVAPRTVDAPPLPFNPGEIRLALRNPQADATRREQNAGLIQLTLRREGGASRPVAC